jgi:tetratricopeptide (TPR) repeat protein
MRARRDRIVNFSLALLAVAVWCSMVGRGALRAEINSPQIAAPQAGDTEDIRQTETFAERIRNNQLKQVKPLLEDYLKQHPDSWRAHYQLGYILFRLHDIQGSIRALSKSLELNLRNAESHKVLGLDLTMLGDYDRAQLEMEQAAALAPESAEIHYFLGRIYYTKNIFPLARREFETALKLDPNYMKAYDNLGLTLEAIGERDAAVASWKRAIELCEKQGLSTEWPFINLAAYYNRQNEAGQALEYAQKAVEKNAESAEAHFQMGRAYRSLQRHEEAEAELQKAVKYNPDNAEYHYVLSIIYRKLGKTAESQKEEAEFRRLKQKESTAGMQGMSAGRMERHPKPSGSDASE